ncbi:MAG: type II toxin-antitoxin system RelE/ParE family toxin [Bacteroidetes bacterium]|nr:type II toxin-antitoxin system RelE/ParE family toxin [Bacteroidota bacterium]
MYRIIITEKAEAEYENAYWYYEEKRSGLGASYEHETNLLLKTIKANPLLFQRKYKQYREALLKRFSYFIVYEIVFDVVVIHSFFHTSRNPAKKHPRKSRL